MKKHKPQIINRALLNKLPLIEYSKDASKADYGKLLIVAGSRRLPGPALLSARAALRCGCGTVRVAAPESLAIHLGIAIPELMIIPLSETSDGTVSLKSLSILQQQYEACDAAILGPGLDENKETNELCRQVLREIPLPLLVDAQAILALGKDNSLEMGIAHGARILTPHPGEMSTLNGEKVEEIEAQREITARNFANEHKITLVLKGRETLIAGPKNELFVNTAGTRGMGTAGSGDVLTGAIGAFLAQGMDATRAAVWGVHLHAVAGEIAVKSQGDDGLMATDFLERLPHALKSFREK